MGEQSATARNAEPNWGESGKSSQARTQPHSSGGVVTLTR